VSAVSYTISEASCGLSSGDIVAPDDTAASSASEAGANSAAAQSEQATSSATEAVAEYFTALRANDTNTLSRLATVQFNQRVDDFKIVSVGPETKIPATLPELIAKRKLLEAELAENVREARAWGNDLDIYPKLDQVRTLEQKGAKVPAKLVPVQEKWKGYNDKDRSLKMAVAEAKASIDRERRNVALSVGWLDDYDVEKLTGWEVATDVGLDLAIGGQMKPFTMTLRKYDVSAGAGANLTSRWIVYGLTPRM
jgi:hypothetical protein